MFGHFLANNREAAASGAIGLLEIANKMSANEAIMNSSVFSSLTVTGLRLLAIGVALYGVKDEINDFVRSQFIWFPGNRRPRPEDLEDLEEQENLNFNNQPR